MPPAIQWAFIDADWIGDSRDACDSGGACWVFVRVRLYQFLYGFYPQAEVWRVNLALGLLVLSAIPLFLRRFARR